MFYYYSIAYLYKELGFSKPSRSEKMFLHSLNKKDVEEGFLVAENARDIMLSRNQLPSWLETFESFKNTDLVNWKGEVTRTHYLIHITVHLYALLGYLKENGENIGTPCSYGDMRMRCLILTLKHVDSDSSSSITPCRLIR